MNKNLPFIIVAALVVATIAGFSYYKRNYLAKYRWYEDYGKSNNEPYGLKLFYSAVTEAEQKTTIVYNSGLEILDTTATNSNFFSVSETVDIDSVMAEQLIRFADKGNHVFIAANNSPLELVRKFIPVGKFIDAYHWFQDTTGTVAFIDDTTEAQKMRFHYQFYKNKYNYYWKNYNALYFDTAMAPYDFEPVSWLNDTTVNSYIIWTGEGKIILHSNPLLFTNYHMATRQGLKHANKFLSLMHKGPVYWYDENIYSSDEPGGPRKTPLKLLFSHPYLKWGWYLFLANILLYLFFRSKREQRIIPLLPVNNNASIEYTKAIGTLYFRSKRHDHLINELYSIFLAEIRNRYNIRTDIPEKHVIDQVSQRSGVSTEELQYLFKQFKLLKDRADVEPEELKDLYSHLEDFNQKRK